MGILLLSLFLVGTFFGIRFHVFVLIPALACALGGTFAIKIVCGEAVPLALLHAGLATAVLQVGYFCGMMLGSMAARGHIFQWQSISLDHRPNR